MKKIIKNNLKVFVAVVISGIIFGGIGVYAANTYLAHDISYTPSNENFDANNVEDALNELYDKTSCSKGMIHHASNTQMKIELGYEPSIFYASFYWPSLDMSLYLTYDKNISSDIYLNYDEKQVGIEGPVVANYNSLVFIKEDGIETNFGGRSLSFEYDFYYVACK